MAAITTVHGDSMWPPRMLSGAASSTSTIPRHSADSHCDWHIILSQ